MPNAGLPAARPERRRVPAHPRRAGRRRSPRSSASTGSRSSAAAAARRPSTSRRWSRRDARRCSAGRAPPAPGAGRQLALRPRCRSGRTRRCSWSASGPTPTAPRSSARPCSPRTGTPASRIAREQTREGAHLIDLCVDYVGRDGVADMAELAGRLATASTLPIMLDSTEPEVLRAGPGAPRRPLDHQLGELRGRRRARLAVPAGDGAGPTSTAPPSSRCASTRRARPAPPSGRSGSPSGSSATSPRNHGMHESRTSSSTRLTFPITTGQEEVRRDALETIEAIRELKRRHPDVQTTLGVSNVSFGLNAAARQVLNSVFLHECVNAGLDTAIVSAAKILPMAKIPDEQRSVALDLVYDRRRPSTGLRPAQPVHGAVRGRLAVVGEGGAGRGAGRAAAVRAAGAADRRRRAARARGRPRRGAASHRPALEIINDTLLAGMKTVGELFGSGQMQLPFVLQSAEVMKAAVAHLEPHMEKTDGRGQGHDRARHGQGRRARHRQEPRRHHPDQQRLHRGQPRHQAADLDDPRRPPTEHRADAIGMSGLLVKSTVVMKENLAGDERARGRRAAPRCSSAARRSPAPTWRTTCRDVYEGRVSYARDAFEGLRLMDATMARRRGAATAVDPAEEAAAGRAQGPPRAQPAHRRQAARPPRPRRPGRCPTRSDVARRQPDPDARRSGAPGWSRASRWPTTPGWSTSAPCSWASGACAGPRAGPGRRTRSSSRPRAGRGCGTGWTGCPPRACWRARPSSTATSRPSPRATSWWSSTSRGPTRRSATGFPSRASAATGTCASPTSGGRASWPSRTARSTCCRCTWSRWAQPIADYANELFAKDAYRDYLEVHGLGVQLTEALAEYWHRRIREELTFPTGAPVAAEDPADVRGLLQPGLPRRPLLARLRRLPEPRRPGEDRRPAAARRASA